MFFFVFDLDGTITKKETLPIIADHFHVNKEIDALTKETVKGNIPFIESFIRRVGMLSSLPVDEISELIGKVELYPKVHEFISANKDNCIVATGNLDCWTKSIMKKIGCQFFSSEAIVSNNKVKKIQSILKKEALVSELQSKGHKVVFIGDGNNDVEAMRIADISIGSGLTHTPSTNVLSICDYAVFSEEALCRQLNQLL